jgi:hypothetical protein
MVAWYGVVATKARRAARNDEEVEGHVYLVVGLNIELDLLACQGSYSVIRSQFVSSRRGRKLLPAEQRAAWWRGSFHLLDKHGRVRG